MEAEFIAGIEANKEIMHYACYRYANKLSREDIIQEILLRAWHSFPTFNGRGLFSQWFFSVCKRTCIDHVRRQKVQKRYIPFSEEFLDNLEYRMEEAEKLEQAIRYNTVIAELPDEDREIFFLYLNGYSFKKIQSLLNIDENNLRVRVHRIKKRLQFKYARVFIYN
jgi:RNA polymerase sigma-70 factor (ECF subfamily)